ncbi:MAG: hypothetical protein ACREVQ_11120 [Burkholderiales bacterium]
MVLIGLAGVLAIIFGIRYLLTKQYMPYHEAVSGKPWHSLELRLQAIILGMLKVAGAGLLGSGAAQLWLLLGVSQGAGWAPWAILTTSLLWLTPILYVVLWLRRIEPSAKTPVAPTALGLSLSVVGVALVWAS